MLALRKPIQVPVVFCRRCGQIVGQVASTVELGLERWSSFFDIKRIMEQFLEQTIVLLEIRCYLLCSAESTLDWIGLDLLSGIMSMALHAENWDL